MVFTVGFDKKKKQNKTKQKQQQQQQFITITETTPPPNIYISNRSGFTQLHTTRLSIKNSNGIILKKPKTIWFKHVFQPNKKTLQTITT